MAGSQEPKHIVAQSVRSVGNSQAGLTNRQLWARVCYYYPQYTLKQASELSIRDIRLLLHTANQIEAQKMYEFTQIAAAPHTKKGKGVKQLTEYFRKIMNN